MRVMLFVLGLIFAAGLSQATAIDLFQGPQPIAVLMQTDPWLMVVGSDTPRVVIYADGQVIYAQREKDKAPVYVHAQMTVEELEKTKKDLASFGDYSTIKSHYDLAPNVTDLPETRIYLNLNSHTAVAGIYGLMLSETRLPGATVFPGGQHPDALPESLRGLCAYLAGLKFAGAKPWEPKYVEAMIWDYSYAPDQSIHWPKNWPGLDSPDTIKRGDSYSIFLPGSEIAKLRDFLNTRKQKGAVEIGGRKWAISFRYVFPGEPVWARAFRNSR